MLQRQNPPSNSLGRFDILVVGAGVAAEIAAVDCARIGLRTLLRLTEDRYESRRAASARGGVIEKACAEFGIACDLEVPRDGTPALLGIPGNPFSPEVRRACGWSGAWRVYLDRLRPLLSIGEERNLARLVAERLGSRLLNLVVRPTTRDLLGCEPEEVDLSTTVPGLLQAMSRVGSLTGGVLELAAADVRNVSLAVPRGGLRALHAAVTSRAEYFAVTREPSHSIGVIAGATIDLSDPHFNRALDQAFPDARRLAASVRAALLSDPKYHPVGPVDLEQ